MYTQDNKGIQAKIAILFACIGVGANIMLAPLIRTLPEVPGIYIFFALTSMVLVGASCGILLGVRNLRNENNRKYGVISIMIGILALGMLLMNFYTSWLWPHQIIA